MKFLRQLLLSVYLLALLPALVVMYFLPHPVKEHTVHVTPQKHASDDQVVYHDLNGDGVTEMIYARANRPLNNFPVTDNEGKFYDQWNLPDELLPGISSLFFGNYDHDAFGEIVVFTALKDSLFLNVNEFFDGAGIKMNREFITTVNLVQGINQATLKPFGYFDTNGDGYDELYFGISTGFGLWPRMVYSFDLVHRKLESSPFTGINFNEPKMADLDGDGRPEIFSNMSSAGNYHTPTPYSDYSVWLMVLDDRLKIKFPPVEFPGFGGLMEVFPFSDGQHSGLLALYNFRSAEKPASSEVRWYSSMGTLVHQRALDTTASPLHGDVLHTAGQDNLVVYTNPLQVLNERLEPVREVRLPFHTEYKGHSFDLTGDGSRHFFLYSPEEETLVVLDQELNLLSSLNIGLPPSEWQASYSIDNKKNRQLFLLCGSRSYLFTLRENPYFWVSYGVYPCIYLAFLGLIWITRRIQRYQIEKKDVLHKRLLTLQLQSLKGQLDPHFMFNALNSISSMLYLDDRKAAYDAMNIFTRLLRQMLNDADRVYRTLQEELDCVTHYLELEKIRFTETFSYSIVMGEGVTRTELVPKMVLQTFAENAVKHGLLPRGNGELRINVQRDKDYLVLTVTDNGIGRAKAAEQKNSIGKGLKINQEFYDILNQMNQRPILETIEDLTDDQGQPAGTRVVVRVPV